MLDDTNFSLLCGDMPDKPKRNSAVISPKEAARQLKIARNLVYQAVADSRLKARKQKGHIYLSPAALKSFKKKLAAPSDRMSAKARRPDQNETIGERLRELRRDRGISQFDLAESFGVSQNAIKNFELNLRRVPHEILIQYHATFGVSIDYLLLGE